VIDKSCQTVYINFHSSGSLGGLNQDEIRSIATSYTRRGKAHPLDFFKILETFKHDLIFFQLTPVLGF